MVEGLAGGNWATLRLRGLGIKGGAFNRRFKVRSTETARVMGKKEFMEHHSLSHGD